VVGLIKNSTKVPFISLQDFVDNSKYEAAKEELRRNKDLKFIGYNGSDWADSAFQAEQVEALPKTVELISTFCKTLPPFNIRWEDSSSTVLLHQDLAPFPCSPWNDLVSGYKSRLKDSIRELMISEDNGLGFDYDTHLKEQYGKEYESEVKKGYKLHMIMSDGKSLFIYDNVTDTIHDINSTVSVFNARDFHDTRPDSQGISIQFPMNPYFLREEIQKYLELI
jgi:hypothetical protein